MARVVAPMDFFHERPVLVTGGTGFIGRRLAATLRERGTQVRMLVRPHHMTQPTGENMETVGGDLADTASLARACEGMDTVIHTAGFAHADAAATPAFADRHWTINAEGTFHLLDAAVAAGVQRFIFLSSVKAMGDPGPRCVDERWDTPPETPYGQAKRAAEAQVLAVGHTSGLHTVNLRLALVYGPGMKGNVPRWINAVRRGRVPPLPETGNRRSLVHVDDVVQAVLLAVAQSAARGQTYLVTDGQPYSGRELDLMIRRALGRPVPRWTVPAAVLYGVAVLTDGALWITGRRERPFRSALDKLLGWACYNSARIEQELGYRPDWTFQRYSETPSWP